jgi:hypothetical protein
VGPISTLPTSRGVLTSKSSGCQSRARGTRETSGRNESVAVGVYDSRQSWGKPDSGVQLFGAARGLDGPSVADAEKLYAARFPGYWETELGAYRFYALRPRRMKLFDEREFGTGVFVTVRIARGGRLECEGTEIYRPAA